METKFKLIVLVIIVSIVILPFLLQRPPQVVAGDAPDSTFSAVRASDHIRQIANAPRSIGTKQHTLVREYIVDQCKNLGLSTSVQSATASRNFGSNTVAAHVQNVIARLNGSNSKFDILLMAHYDSQPNTPGAGDNAAGVATLLETARLLAAGRQQSNNIIFLFTDAEEQAMLGAHAFMQDSSLQGKIKLALNLEGRGNDGPSIMFETSDQNGWLIKEYARAAKHPNANSVNFELYRLLPNDTDYSIFKKAGVHGFNHAFIGGYVNYHSMTDRPENLNLRSVQHHGANISSLVRHFGSLKSPPVSKPNVSYFNILGSWLVYYSATWNVVWTAIAICLTLTLTYLNIRQGQSFKRIIKSSMLLMATTVCAFIVTLLFLNALTILYPLNEYFYAANSYNAQYYYLALACVGVSMFGIPLNWASKKYGQAAVVNGVLLFVSILDLLILWIAPTAAYLLTFPVIFASSTQIYLSISKVGPEQQHIKSASALIIGALPVLVFLPRTITLMFTALGLGPPAAIVMLAIGIFVSMTFVLQTLIFEQRELIALLTIGSLFVIAISLGHINSSFTEHQPRQTRLRYEFDADRNAAEWVLEGRMDKASVKYFPKPRVDTIKTKFGPQIRNDAPHPNVAPTELLVLKDTLTNKIRSITLSCLNKNNAQGISFHFRKSDGVKRIAINGVDVAGSNSMALTSFVYFGFARSGFLLDFETDDGPLEFTVNDVTVGFPESNGYPSGVIPGPGYTSNVTLIKKKHKL